MPIYDYKCPSCDETQKDVFVHNWDTKITCKCGKTMQKLISTGIAAKVFPSDGIFLEHVSPEGKRFYSKKEMQDYAKKHDLELGALE